MSVAETPRGRWGAIARKGVLFGSASALLITLGALLFDSGEAAISAATGALIVLVLSWTSLALIDITDRRAPQHTIAVFMIAFALKLVVLAALLSMLSVPVWMHPTWAVISAAVALLSFQTAVVLAFNQLRLHVHTSDH